MRQAYGSPRRLVLLGGPGGYLTVARAGGPRLGASERWTELLRVNVPRRFGPLDVVAMATAAGAMKQWALDVYGANA